MWRLLKNQVVKYDKKNSFMIGDQLTDIQFAKKANIKGYLFKETDLYKFVKKNVA